MQAPACPMYLRQVCDYFGISQTITLTTKLRALGIRPAKRGKQHLLTCAQLREVARTHYPQRAGEFEVLWQSCQEHGPQASRHIAEFIEWIPPSDGFVRQTWFPTRMGGVLRRMSRAPGTPVVLVRGARGSALRDVAACLADYLAAPPADFAARYPSLTGYRWVYRLSAPGAKALVRQDGQDPRILLQHIKQHIERDEAIRTEGTSAARASTLREEEHSWRRAVLVVDHVEVLATDPTPTGHEARLWEALTAAHGLALVALYHLDRRPEPVTRFLEDHANADRVLWQRVVSHTAEETREFLRRCHYPGWLAAGFEFDEDAFDTAMELEPGICVNGEHETLPYLAVDLGTQTINSALAVDPAAEFALLERAARGALRQLRGPRVDAALRRPFEPALAAASQELDLLSASPAPRQRVREDGRVVCVLTRAHVTAQLLSPSDSYFSLETAARELAKVGH